MMQVLGRLRITLWLHWRYYQDEKTDTYNAFPSGGFHTVAFDFNSYIVGLKEYEDENPFKVFDISIPTWYD